jgi:hypothetical protein
MRIAEYIYEELVAENKIFQKRKELCRKEAHPAFAHAHS